LTPFEGWEREKPSLFRPLQNHPHRFTHATTTTTPKQYNTTTKSFIGMYFRQV
jgi:hypothetical protein